MSLKTKIKLTIFLTACMAACLFAGCKVGGISKDDFVDKYGVAGQYVTYYANGGNFNSKATRTQMDIYYRPDSYIICSDQNNFKVERKFFTFDGWYYIEVDADGNPVLDEDEDFIYKDKVSPNDLVEGGVHLSVAAKWTPVIAIDVYVITDDGEPIKDINGNEYNSGDKIGTQNFGSADKPYGLTQSHDAISAVGATYLYFFADEQCTIPVSVVTMPVSDDGEKPEEDGEQEGDLEEDETQTVENVKVYAKYLRGNWKIVSDASGVSEMLKNVNSSDSYYLFSTDASGVINCANLSGSAIAPMNNGVCNLNLQGNGVTIENLSVSPRDASGNPLTIIQSASYSLFGNLSATAQISDVKFKNLNVSATASSMRPMFMNIYLANHGIAQGAKVEGLVFEDVKMSLTTTPTVNIENIPLAGGGAYDSANWLFGGLGSDDEFLESYGVTVSGASLYINETAVVENISKTGGLTK